MCSSRASPRPLDTALRSAEATFETFQLAGATSWRLITQALTAGLSELFDEIHP